MRPGNRKGATILAFAAWSLVSSEARAQLARGPYLQAAGSTQVTVLWRTAAAGQGRVRAGTSAGMLTLMADEPQAATAHAVTLTNLQPGTRYFYSVGTPDAVLAGGDDFSFVTAPAPGTAGPTRLWVLGDSGTGNADAARVRDAFLAFNRDHPLDVWLMLGDNAYPKGTDEQYQQALFDFFPALLRGHGLWTAIGNADILCCEGAGVARAPYFHIFSPPTAGEAGGVGSGNILYYSFDHGDVHVVVLDSTVSDRSPGGPMLTWLRRDLEANRSAWLIAAFHHPPYTAGEHDSDFEQGHVQMRQNALPILEEHGVDLVLGGHSHDYERSVLLDGHYGTSDTLTAAMKKDPGTGRPEEGGPYRKTSAPHQGAVYVVAGNASEVTSGPLSHPAMAVSELGLGSLVVDIEGSELRATFLRDTGDIDDHFVIVKTQLPPAEAPDGGADATVVDAMVVTDAMASSDAPTAGDAGAPTDSGGCGCALGGPARPAGTGVLLLLGLLLRRRPRDRKDVP
jgi:MYXO-CTERM domain-containing protein